MPEPVVILRRSASEAYVQAMRRLSLVADREPDTDQPVYLSRAGLGAGGTLRQILGESLLDTALEQAGVKILRLQDMSFEDGLRALARHKTIIGPLGSALHNSVFLGPRRLVYLANAINPDKLRTFLALDRAAGHETIIMRFSDLIQDGRSAAWATGFNKGSEGNALIDFNVVLAALCDLDVIADAPRVNMDDPVLSDAKRAYLTALRERSLPAQPPQLHETLLAEITSLT